MHKHITEAIGTFFLVLTICLSVKLAGALAPIAIGLVLMVMVYMGGHISGAHYNPAVTLAALMRGALDKKEVAPYMAFQIGGALFAAFIGLAILNSVSSLEIDKMNRTQLLLELEQVLTTEEADQILGPAGELAREMDEGELKRKLRKHTPVAPELKPAKDMTLFALLLEFLFTFALCLVVLNVATSPKTEGNSFYGAAIGITVMVGAFAAGPISGGGFNPAVGVGLIVVELLDGADTIAYIWLYLAGPLVGGALAAVVYKVQHPEEEPDAV